MCDICGRSSCSRSFHSNEEQESYDTIADPVKESMRNSLINSINRLDVDTVEGDDETCYVKLNEVVELLNDYN